MTRKTINDSIILLAMTATYLLGANLACALNVDVPAGGNIQTAINQVVAAGGGEVFLASGTWTLSSSITLGSGVKIAGAGEGKTIIQGPSTTYNWPLFTYTTDGLTYCTVEQMTLYGRVPTSAFDFNSSTSQSAPYFNSVGIFIACPDTGDDTNIDINNVEIKNTSEAVMMKGISGLTIATCNFHSNGGFYWNHSAYIRRCLNWTMSNTISSGSQSGDGLHIADPSSATIVVSGCTFTGNASMGINCQDTPAGVKIESCTMSNNLQDGMDFTGTGAQIRDNTLDNNAGYGLYTIGGTGTVDDNTATGNPSGNYNEHGSFTYSDNN